jgi:hypothetical protein
MTRSGWVTVILLGTVAANAVAYAVIWPGQTRPRPSMFAWESILEPNIQPAKFVERAAVRNDLEQVPASNISKPKTAEEESLSLPSHFNAPKEGTLLVTTTPPGLVILLNRKPVDLTPARVSLKEGLHRVTLKRGNRRLFDETIQVVRGSAKTIDMDFSAELAPSIGTLERSPLLPSTGSEPSLNPVTAPGAAQDVVGTEPEGVPPPVRVGELDV